eukprot:CAMPEP_0182507642 /NCGR_PEP_ID=MMETSP1321-20130603/23544_1 /TAXON_ID=91990 /ORGANISM="Bolidomonas sp., Strain RCC1657" /LENGTH=143 /DNA_ID=CAMNT_0024713579 /DNA_START=710 /DNA_END=1140 /DNA_ORIENTATION=-
MAIKTKSMNVNNIKTSLSNLAALAVLRLEDDGAPPQIYNDAKANVKGEERKQVKGIHFHAVLGRVQRYVVDVLGDFGDGAQQREDVEPEVLLSNPERVNVAVGIGGEEPEEGAAAPSPLFLKGRQELVVVLCVYFEPPKGDER